MKPRIIQKHEEEHFPIARLPVRALREFEAEIERDRRAGRLKLLGRSAAEAAKALKR